MWTARSVRDKELNRRRGWHPSRLGVSPPSSSSLSPPIDISFLDHNQYSTWNRTRRIQASPFLARTDTRTSRTATAMAQNGAVLINMAPEDNSNKKESKQLFGPDIGVVNNVPAWAHNVGKNAAADALSADVIKSWVTKSKEVSYLPSPIRHI